MARYNENALLYHYDTLSIITAELGRALAIVKVIYQVYGNTHYSGSGHPKTISAIKMKLGTIDYVAMGEPTTNIWQQSDYWGLLPIIPSPPLDNIRVMVIVWRLRGNIIRTALRWIV